MSLKALCISQNTLSALTYSTRQLPSLWLHPPHVPGFGASPLLADCVYSGFLSPNPPKDTVLAVGFVPPCVAIRGWGAVLPLPMPCRPIWHLFPGPAGRGAGPGPRQMFLPGCPLASLNRFTPPIPPRHQLQGQSHMQNPAS